MNEEIRDEEKEINVKLTNKVNQNSISRPAFNLEKAVTIADTIYKEHSLNAFDDGMLASLLGHKTKNSGAYTRNKGGLSHYGLIERISEGKNKDLLKLSENYINYITELDETKKSDYLESFFNNPGIYKSIREWFPNLEIINRKALIMQVVRNKKVDESIGEEVADNFMQSLEYLNSKKPIKTQEENISLPQEEIQSALKNDSVIVSKVGQESNYILHDESMTISFSLSIKELSKMDLIEALEALESMKGKLSREMERRFPNPKEEVNKETEPNND